MVSRASFIGLASLVSLACSSLAWAGPLNQPNNTPIPQGNSLQANGFDALMDPVNAILDAEITPPTFIPSCTVEFTVHLRNAGYQNAFGWYNANGVAPAFEDLHQILDCDEPVGTSKQIDILGDPNYEGGEVGFFQAVGGCADVANPASVIHVLYSETQWNPDSNQMNPFIHLLIYQSALNPRTYYFAWEDLLQGGDNDFEDLFTSVDGISCVGGGPCEIVATPGDNDADLVCGGDDNCPMVSNADQADADGDLVGDACDPCPDDPDPACVGGTDTNTSSDTGGMSSSDTGGMTSSDTGGMTASDTSAGDTSASDTSAGDTSGMTAGETSAGETSAGDTSAGDTSADGGTGNGEGGSDGGGSGDELADEVGSLDADAGSGDTGLDDGCGCTSHSSSPGSLASLLALLGLLGLRRRR